MWIHNLLARSSTRRRARNHRPSFFTRVSRHTRPFSTTVSLPPDDIPNPTLQQEQQQQQQEQQQQRDSSSPQLPSSHRTTQRRHSTIRNNLNFHSQSSHRSQQQQQTQKPIYIYPGLLRVVRDKAIALDNQCPAVVYKCRECRRQKSKDDILTDKKSSSSLSNSTKQNKSTTTICPHRISCSICLDEFHNKDLVRKLPCNSNHIFHSKCILDWFLSNHKCPLCIQPVLNTYTTSKNSNLSPNSNDSISDSSAANVTRARSFLHRSSRRYQRATRRFSLSNDPVYEIRQDTSPTTPPISYPININHSDDRMNSQEQNNEENTNNHQTDINTKSSTEKSKKKSKGPRTYSYIVHDNVRMELNTNRYI